MGVGGIVVCGAGEVPDVCRMGRERYQVEWREGRSERVLSTMNRGEREF